ncbi:MAG: hypothetical protein IRZ32_14080 [Solirubrobacteraceae bacterium]|nr:hypothetical protein [Solirubrobacteraceae bacterium]
MLGRPSPRLRRRAREAAVEARLPIEVSWLRLELRDALTEVTASRTRITTATTEASRRLQRDLHDGAQQQIVAVGMRLRSLQHRFAPPPALDRELDQAVDALAATVEELRRLAHGIRPSLLDDGLPAALYALAEDSPVPVSLDIAGLADAPGAARPAPADLPDLAATTAYFVVSEALANAFKHADAASVTVRVELAGPTAGPAGPPTPTPGAVGTVVGVATPPPPRPRRARLSGRAGARKASYLANRSRGTQAGRYR